MRTYVIDNGTKYIDQLIETLSAHNPILVSYDDLRLNEIGDNDIVILSGGHGYPVLWHNEEYKNEIDIIKNHNGPIIGICLGFELISHVFGSHLHLLKQRRKGIVTIKPVIENNILKSDLSLEVYENHNWSVQKLKKPLIVLAVSDDGVEILKHASRPIYGMQFHPEGVYGNGKTILDNILKELKAHKLLFNVYDLFCYSDLMKTIAKRLHDGQDLFDEVASIALQNDIKAGVILSAVGSLKEANIRVPVIDGQVKYINPMNLEIDNLHGTVSKNGVHLHISVSDTAGAVMGGHLKEGCIIRTTCELVIGILDDLEFKREFDPKTGFDELLVR